MKNKMIIFPIIAIIIFITLAITVFTKKRDKDNKPTPVEKNNFNINLIKQVDKNRKENYLISPYSIEIALNLLKEGANGNTLKEIENLIGNRELTDLTIKNRLSVANAAFIKKDYQEYVLKSYIKDLENKYNSELLYDEFKTPKVINDWVKNKTNGMIDKILDEINKDFVLGLANALAIDVEWYDSFECENTRSKEFTKDDGSKIEVEMMHKRISSDSYKYLENDNAKGIIIPYKSYNKTTGEEDFGDSNLEFIGILPNSSISEYINNLTDNELKDLLSNSKTPSDNLEINLSLPRFKYDYELKDFKEVLMSLGIIDVFNKNNADFTKMIPRNNKTGNIYVGEAIHKTHIDLNEKGTKAAAVTYFGMFKSTGIMPQEKESINIEFNKPFLYMIIDSKSNEILFLGAVYEPNKWVDSTCENVN